VPPSVKEIRASLAALLRVKSALYVGRAVRLALKQRR
jgi:hypothetical protein